MFSRLLSRRTPSRERHRTAQHAVGVGREPAGQTHGRFGCGRTGEWLRHGVDHEVGGGRRTWTDDNGTAVLGPCQQVHVEGPSNIRSGSGLPYIVVGMGATVVRGHFGVHPILGRCTSPRRQETSADDRNNDLSLHADGTDPDFWP